MDKKKFISKIKNPKGPFKMKFSYTGVEVDCIIEHTSMSDFVIKLKSKNKNKNKNFFDKVKDYLIKEGFVDLAEKHNLFW
jgi:hypothetical protein